MGLSKLLLPALRAGALRLRGGVRKGSHTALLNYQEPHPTLVTGRYRRGAELVRVERRSFLDARMSPNSCLATQVHQPRR